MNELINFVCVPYKRWINKKSIWGLIGLIILHYTLISKFMYLLPEGVFLLKLIKLDNYIFPSEKGVLL